MKFFKALGFVVRPLVALAIAVVEPATLINTALGAVVKHGTPISNKSIPLLNLVASSGLAFVKHGMSSGDWMGAFVPAVHTGMILAGGSTLLHQSIKTPIKNMTGKGI